MKNEPTLLQTWVFLTKAFLLQFRRACRNMADPRLGRFTRHPFPKTGDPVRPILAESITPLWTADDASEKSLLAGKIHNLRIATRHIHGLEVPAGGLFSFWAHIGRAHRLKGYVLGRELREGCVVPAIAGGLCQLSNALYDAAARAGLEIVERHTHTRIIPGSLAESGRDATVFWNYLDLRFTSPQPFRIEADLNADSLRVRIRGIRAKPRAIAVVSMDAGKRILSMHVPDNCWTCGVTECFRHQAHAGAALDFGKTAFLVDEHWPEYDGYLKENARTKDVLGLPIDGRRWGKRNYAWRTEGFARTQASWWVTTARAYRSRRLAGQGAERQKAILDFHEKLAASYAPMLTFDVTHVTVMQSLLPYLWRDGWLGGRTFDVLMTALPLSELHLRLDEASALNPESPTLADFRAPEILVRLESEALRQARKVITSHSEIAGLYPDKTFLTPWKIPEALSGWKHLPRKAFPGQARPFTIAFPATTVGRKGAYPLRSALRILKEEFGGRGLEIRVLCLGPQLEGPDFWAGLAMQRGSEGWMAEADVVVLPAFVEHRPRRLLEAVSRGIPVIASSACGLGSLRGVHIVPSGDVNAIVEALVIAFRNLEPVSTAGD